MTAEWKVREGTTEDVEAVVSLERAVAEAPHWGEGEYGRLVAGDPGGAVRRRLVVAEAEGRIVGFGVGLVMRAGDEAWGELESVAVDPAWRRRGVGRGLCEAVLGWCAAEGAKQMELEVRAGSSGARAMYAAMGFEAEGIRPGYYREPEEDAVMMRRAEGKGGC